MRVVILAWRDIENPEAGGSEVVMHHLAQGLVRRGHRVVLVCAGEHGTHEYPVVRNAGRGTQYLFAPWATRRFRDADVLVEVVNGMPFLTDLWWHGPRVSFVHHVHGDQWHQHFGWPVGPIGQVLETRLFPAVARRDLVVTVSPSTRDELAAIGFDPDAVRVLRLGLDESLRVDEPTEAPEPLFVACGRLSPNKQYGLLLDLWDEVRRTTGGRLVLVGEGIERAQLAERLPPDVTLAGFVDEATKSALFRDAWLFVHTARQEGWGLVLLEAAAAGTPSLALDAPGVRDAIVDGVSGVLAPSPEAMVKEWVDLVADTERRGALARGALERSRSFDWEHTVEQFEAALVEAVDRRVRRRGRRR